MYIVTQISVLTSTLCAALSTSILYGRRGGKISVQGLRGGAKLQHARLEGGLNFSARDFEKRANLPPPVNFDRSLNASISLMVRFHFENLKTSPY